MWGHTSESLMPHTPGKQPFNNTKGSYRIVLGQCDANTPTRCRQTQAHAAFSSSCPKATKPRWYYGASVRKTHGSCCKQSHSLQKSTHSLLKLVSEGLRSGNVLKIHIGLSFHYNFSHNSSLALSIAVVSKVTPPTCSWFSCSQFHFSDADSYYLNYFLSLKKNRILDFIESWVSLWITLCSFSPPPQTSRNCEVFVLLSNKLISLFNRSEICKIPVIKDILEKNWFSCKMTIQVSHCVLT